MTARIVGDRGVARRMAVINKSKKRTDSLESLPIPESLRTQGSGTYSPVMELLMGGDRRAHPLPLPQ